jgi:hypothetical protein
LNVVKVDNKRRVRIPEFRPGQVYTYTSNPGGSVTLTEMKPVQPKPPKVRVVTECGRKLLSSDRKVSNEDVQKALEEFP